VQRVDADDASSGARGSGGDYGERREIADALVAFAPKGIEMRGEAEAPGTGAKLGRQKAANRRRNDTARRGRDFRTGRSGDCRSRRSPMAARCACASTWSRREIPSRQATRVSCRRRRCVRLPETSHQSRGDTRRRREPVEDLGRQARLFPPGRCLRLLRDDDHRVRRDRRRVDCAGVLAGACPVGDVVSIDRCHAKPSRASGHCTATRSLPALKAMATPLPELASLSFRSREDRDQDPTLGINPVRSFQQVAVRTRHSTSGNPPGTLGIPVSQRSSRSAACVAQVDEPRHEGDERLVRRRPIDPGERVVLRVAVVVAALRAAQLIAHPEHGSAARAQECGEQVANVAPARGDDRGIVRRSLDAVVPRVVDVAAVAVAFAVRLVVLGRVGDDIGEREAVVRGDEIDRSRGRPDAGCEDVGRAREARRQLADASRVAAPEPARRVAIAVVPFTPSGRERAETIAARPDIPRLGDELQLAQHGILLDGLEEGRAASKPSARRPSVVARSKRNPSTPATSA
jgi:hypothetical protein